MPKINTKNFTARVWAVNLRLLLLPERILTGNGALSYPLICFPDFTVIAHYVAHLINPSREPGNRLGDAVTFSRFGFSPVPRHIVHTVPAHGIIRSVGFTCHPALIDPRTWFIFLGDFQRGGSTGFPFTVVQLDSNFYQIIACRLLRAYS